MIRLQVVEMSRIASAVMHAMAAMIMFKISSRFDRRASLDIALDIQTRRRAPAVKCSIYFRMFQPHRMIDM